MYIKRTFHTQKKPVAKSFTITLSFLSLKYLQLNTQIFHQQAACML